MATTIVNTSRSLHGCWTCRLRKKKCDENHPSCSTCISLELDCHGYGPRPKWMYKGVLEREKALQVKRIISETKSNRRQRQFWCTPQHLRPERDSIPVAKTTSLSLPLSGPTQQTAVIQGSTAPKHHLQLHGREGDLTTSNQPMRSERFYNVILPAEPFFNQESGISPSYKRPSDAATATKYGDMEYNSASSDSSERALASTFISSDLCKDSARNGIDVSREAVPFGANVEALVPLCQPKLSASCHDIYLSKEYIFGIQACSSSFLQKSSSLPAGPMGYHASSLASVCESILRRDMEDSLLMHYLDEVFYIQYPFYHSVGRRGRGWLFTILRRAKPAYCAALALSEHHQNSTLPILSSISRSPHRLREKGGHYDQALREMQLILAQSTGNLDLSRNIEILTSVLLLLFWEVRLPLLSVVFNADKSTQKLFGGGRQNWQTHLGAAATLVPALVNARMTSTTADSTRLGHEDRWLDEKVPHSEDDSAVEFLLGSFISIDIISCASTRSSPFLELDHKFMLERGGVHLENLTGCRNWAMIFIFEISLLDKWKKEAETAHKLSIVELTKRGGQIEARLWEKLADIDNEYSTGFSSGNTSGILSASASSEITRIFALSAMTYLHVVMSGAYPELPEIMESVSKTIDAFQSLTDSKLLRNLVWPFCISGCLSLDGQQAIFWDLVSVAEITQSTVGTCFEALKIMEECWNARKTSSYNCDWVSGMKKRGYNVLLH